MLFWGKRLFLSRAVLTFVLDVHVLHQVKFVAQLFKMSIIHGREAGQSLNRFTHDATSKGDVGDKGLMVMVPEE